MANMRSRERSFQESCSGLAIHLLSVDAFSLRVEHAFRRAFKSARFVIGFSRCGTRLLMFTLSG
jgi:hypothetical protein